MQLQIVPYCEACFQNNILTDCVQGGHIDHIVRRAAGGAELDERNLQTLCRMHHDRKSALERHGLQVKAEGPEGCRVPVAGEKERILKLIG